MTIREDGDIHLCQVRADELEGYAHWQTHGQWRQFDVPWEHVRDSWEPEALSEFREKFLTRAARHMERAAWKTQTVSLCTLYYKDDAIGWMSSYGFSHDRTSAKVGICIAEDSCLGVGLGTRSLRLWVDYLFVERKLHRVGLDTWSFNPRMIRVAEKCGFVPEGIEREVQRWDGAWRDMHYFGMTEDEYARIAKDRAAAV